MRSGSDEPKQFRRIAGVPMLLRAIRPFAQLSTVHQIVVALPDRYAADVPSWLADVVGDRLRVTAGARVRALSVARALAVLDPGCSVVLVHDAARPFVSPDTIQAVIDAASLGQAAVAAVPVADTLKRVDPITHTVVETVDRQGLWRAQTPQGFPRHMLEQAFRVAKDVTVFTDECGLVESMGCSVRLVPDRTTNIKVTTPQDFAIAESLAVG